MYILVHIKITLLCKVTLRIGKWQFLGVRRPWDSFYSDSINQSQVKYLWTLVFIS